MLRGNHCSGSTNFFFNLLGKINFVQKIGGKKLTEANPRELTTICSKNYEC